MTNKVTELQWEERSPRGLDDGQQLMLKHEPVLLKVVVIDGNHLLGTILVLLLKGDVLGVATLRSVLLLECEALDSVLFWVIEFSSVVHNKPELREAAQKLETLRHYVDDLVGAVPHGYWEEFRDHLIHLDCI